MKRMVSLSLAVCLLAASLPLPVYAEEPPRARRGQSGHGGRHQ